jgi:hypothetical protein
VKGVYVRKAERAYEICEAQTTYQDDFACRKALLSQKRRPLERLSNLKPFLLLLIKTSPFTIQIEIANMLKSSLVSRYFVRNEPGIKCQFFGVKILIKLEPD